MAQHCDNLDFVLDEVISRINRIAEHLSDSGETEASRHLTDAIITAFTRLCEVTSQWSALQLQMKPVVAVKQESVPVKTEVKQESYASITATVPTTNPPDCIVYSPVVATSHVDTDANHRVLWVKPWSATRPLRDITHHINCFGALYSIAHEPDWMQCCIIFQHAHAASAFFHHCLDLDKKGHNLFGPGTEVVTGQSFDSPDLGRMDMPFGERRRLTVARQQLFANGLTETKFRQELEKLVKPTDIEVLHLFNTGNATVVFSAVPLARLVRAKLMELSHKPGSPYEGIMINYSSDPCEKPLTLVKSDAQGYMSSAKHGHRPSYGSSVGIPGVPRGPSAGNVNAGRSQSAMSIDAPGNIKDSKVATPAPTNGWTTVKRK